VEFRGIRIGQVTDLSLQFNANTYRFDIPVMVEIEPGRIEILGGDLPENENGGVIGQLVEKGLRGQLKTGSLLTGQLFVDLDFQEETAPVAMARQGDFWIIPTVPTSLDALANRLKVFLAQVETWPIEQLGADVGEAIRSFKTLMASDDLRKSLDHIEQTLGNLETATRRLNRELIPQAEGVIGKAGDLVERNAPLYLDLKQLLQEVSAAARAVRTTADYLGRHPESLIRGK
jgi:paraquat-inducible protein B